MDKQARKFAKLKILLFQKIQPLLDPYRIEKESILDAIEKSLQEIKLDRRSMQQWLLPLIYWKIFKDEHLLLINRRTPAGNKVSLDVLTTAHALWGTALLAAAKRGIDDIDATEAMIQIVNVITDRFASSNSKPIRNLHKYLITGYMNVLRRMDRKTDAVCRSDCYPPDKDVSDDGTFMIALETKILCDERVAKLPPKEEYIAFFRHMMGYSCKETAALVDLSNNAARKALCIGIQKYFGAEMRDMRTADSVEAAITKIKCRSSGEGANEKRAAS